MNELFDVIAVNLETNTVRLIAQKKHERNAEAIVSMAVCRRGVEREFFGIIPSSTYQDGDTYIGVSGGLHDATTESAPSPVDGEQA